MEGVQPKASTERRDMLGRTYTRRKINGHWVEYTFHGGKGYTRRVAFPRVQIVSDEAIAASNAE